MGTNWLRVLAAFGLPPLIAVPLAILFWARRQMTVGTVVGVGVFFVAAIAFSGIEYVESLRFWAACLQSDTTCRSSGPDDFARITAYGFVAMVQGMALFLLEASVERHEAEKGFDTPWRR